ncbi:hypothetical protein [Saccharothrix sp. NRRL B-16348]|nr:hypothetical protein [Saccharothrix sp. NRRL B-16348]
MPLRTGVVLQKRLELGIKAPGTTREVTVDRMTFNVDGTITPIVPTL